jgi:hypothetical protein
MSYAEEEKSLIGKTYQLKWMKYLLKKVEAPSNVERDFTII